MAKTYCFHSFLTVCSIISECCRAQRNIIHTNDFKWYEFQLALHWKCQEKLRVTNLAEISPNSHLPETWTGFCLSDKIGLIITLRASASCNIKYFNLLPKLSLKTQTTENKILFSNKCLFRCSSQGYLAVR